MKLTAELLQLAIGAAPDRAALFAPHLAAACTAYQIDTPARLAAFLAQIGHESAGLRHVREVWGPTPAQQRYEGRADLGNVQPGDGRRFAGHGLIQTTGRFNHRAVRDRLRLRGIDAPDFEASPDLLAEPKWAAWSAADYWDWRGCNELADSGSFEAITIRVNGGTNGQADRLERWARAKDVLATSPSPATENAATAAPGPAPTAYEEEGNMPIPAAGLLWGLAANVIEAFTPLAREKITKELGRHTDNPEVAGQVTTAIIETAKAMTGKPDPVAAVAAAKADPAAMAKMETQTLASLDSLMPVLERLSVLDAQAMAAEEASRNAADERARLAEKDQDHFLTHSIVGMFIGLMVSLAVLIGVLIKLSADAGTVGTLVGLFAAAGGAIVGALNTRMQHRYGSSRGSAAKDVLTAELARRPKQAP